ncbi:DUF4266 domain-containing protein [Owenweeksia hongkongensis]|uniref:DUF4266 domain-containing protein n=1 Tax=Owenweeksia hongkongensis TaxID=253245 RepID=UPI003A8E3B8E
MNKLAPILLIILTLLCAACTGVKPYQRSYLNDASMQSGNLEIETFEQGVFNYREGAMGSGTKKGKGGCGCN